MTTDDANPQFSRPIPDDVRREAVGLVRDFATGRPTTADMEVIRRWRAQGVEHERAWVAACMEWRKLGEITRAFDVSHPAPSYPPASRMGRRAFFGATASAAGVLGVAAFVRPPLGLWPSWSELRADYRTGVGEQREVALDATTLLSLNTRTSVALQSLAGQRRIELIAGEAALSVRAGACEMVAGNGQIEVANGEIEVRLRDGGPITLSCSAGTARLRHPGGGMDLRAGQQVVYDDRAVHPVGRPSPAAYAWRQGVVVFQDLALDDVVDEINRYRAGRVVLMNADLARHRLSARFSIAELDDAITHIEQMYRAKVRRVGNVVFIT
jgi:transmembrane sensor